jgi:hypothetical protein
MNPAPPVIRRFFIVLVFELWPSVFVFWSLAKFEEPAVKPKIKDQRPKAYFTP